MLRAESISFRIQDKYLLKDSSLDFEQGKFHVIMGANGAGKSTLLKLLAGDLTPSSGKIIFDGRDLSAHSKKELATKRSVLSQHYHINFPINVSDIVMMGRYPYFSAIPTVKDNEICRTVMEELNVAAMADRDYNTLSGGEAQKVQMCRVLAQIHTSDGESKTLFLDEPVSHLDIKYQHQLLKAAQKLCNDGNTVVAVLHDINLAISYADKIYLMKQGQVYYLLDDPYSITTAMIHDIFDVSARILEADGKPVILF